MPSDPNTLYFDPGGASRDVTLPAEASSSGKWFRIVNEADAAENLVVKDDGGSTIVTIGQNEEAQVTCNGTAWKGVVGPSAGSTLDYLTSTGTVAGASSQAQDFQSNGIKADKIAESTAAAGITQAIGGVDVKKTDDAAISSFAAATDTAGADVYEETQDAGATPTAARAGGAYSMKTGDGAAAANAVACGAGGAMTHTAGAGGANTGGATGQVGGAGGAQSVVAGAGGATNSTGAHAGGAGGAVAVTAGAGGAASAGTGDGGAGGNLTLTPGAGGSSSGGNAGAPGSVVAGGFSRLLYGTQTIDMSDAGVTLTRVPGTPTGTLLTGAVLLVDPNSGEASEILKLPPEADMAHALLIIKNTGGEHIVVQTDAGGAICQIDTAEAGIVHCDGTTWTGLPFAVA